MFGDFVKMNLLESRLILIMIQVEFFGMKHASRRVTTKSFLNVTRITDSSHASLVIDSSQINATCDSP